MHDRIHEYVFDVNLNAKIFSRVKYKMKVSKRLPNVPATASIIGDSVDLGHRVAGLLEQHNFHRQTPVRIRGRSIL